MNRPRPLVMEGLEERCVPVTWNNPWPDGLHLTLSFAPDGTAVGAVPSNLFATFNARTATRTWQLEVLRAFQTWAVQANINIGLVADGGQPLGAVGRPQGDARYGDVRIAAAPMSAEVMAISTPFEVGAGTLSGDVRINSNAPLAVGDPTRPDLRTALLHEAGHVFGLEHSREAGSVMVGSYSGVRRSLTAEDIADIQTLYGARSADGFEGSSGNDAFGRATPLSLLQNADSSFRIAAEADLTTRTDVDFYRFQAPLALGGLTVRLKTSGVSLVVPRVTLYDAFGRVLGSQAAVDPLSGDLTVRLSSYNPLATYYVKVEGVGEDLFRVGGYRLEIETIPLLPRLLDTINGTTPTVLELLNNDLHTNDSLLTATLIPPLTTRTSSQFDFAFRGSISDRWDVDYYRIQAPTPEAGKPNVLTVMAWGIDHSGLVPRVSVVDAFGRAVASTVVVSENGVHTIQVTDAGAGATYFVRVVAADPYSSTTGRGNYFLGVDFSNQAAQFETLSARSLDGATPTRTSTLTVERTQLFHLVLTATSAGAATAVAVTVRNQQGAVVAQLTALAGDAASVTLLLTPGKYRFSFQAVTTNGTAPAPVAYAMRGQRISDPIGPEAADSTEDPQMNSGQGGSSTSDGGAAGQNGFYDYYGYDYYYSENWTWADDDGGVSSDG